MTKTLMPQAGNAIQVPDAPNIPGLSFRHFKGESDYPGMLAVTQACREADGVEEVDTLEDIARRYSKLKNCDPYKDMVMVEADGKLIGFTRVAWQEELDGTRVYRHFGLLQPGWRGKGIGTALLRRNENHLREIARSHPQSAPKFFEGGTYDNVTGLVGLFESEGYKPVRHGYDMVRPDLENLPDVSLPEGIEVRPVDKENREQMHQIWEAEVEAFRDHWGESTVEEADFERWDIWGNFQPELWQVAWEANQVVGMVRNFIDHELNAKKSLQRGYTENISVRRPWRKRGVARALIARSFRMLKELGMTEAALSVDATNPNGARQLYESMGFKTVKSGTTYRKPME